MKCPHCSTTELVMSDRQGVEIDYCPQCRGVWLDRGELDKILERSAKFEASPYGGAVPPMRQQYDDDDDDDDRRKYPPAYGGQGGVPGQYQPGQYPPGQYPNQAYPPQKKKSFWSELFD